VKDIDEFLRTLERPFPVPMEGFVTVGAVVTDAELEADAASFMAFAAAFGVRPPAAGGEPDAS
jgi:hypothetical protein